MPAPDTAEEMLGLIRKSDLVPEARIESALAGLPGHAADPPRVLAARLVGCGLITQFQAEQFLQGKWRGFTIGKYRVLERLGSGGMGTVYLCEHAAVGKKAAVKVLPSNQAANPSALGRFYREARAAGSLDHPNLVRAHDIDEDGGLHFLVMDYVDGASLNEIVTRFGPMEPARACHYIRQSALGLHHAFQGGLVHRDVKPANIMIERNGTARVLDLGLARFYQDNTDPLTLKYDDKHVLGTADYVAPEQALNSHDVDQRADIYSLGGTLYFLLTGRPPFPEGKVAQKLIWHQVRQPTPVRDLRPEVPEAVAAVVARMMAKDPADRYQTHAEVVEVLTPLAVEGGPPPEKEMPRLCPAALSGMSGPIVTPKSNQGTKKKPTAGPMPMGSGGVATLHREPPAAEMATPRAMARETVRTEKRRATPAVAPSRKLERGEEAESGSWSGAALLTLLLAAGGAAVGVALAFFLAR